jgi:hypothetical protein
MTGVETDESRSSACWTVEERAWKQELPHLPDEVIALLATPVVVSASTFVDVLARPEPAAEVAPAVAVADRSPRFLAPAPPRNTRPSVGRGIPRHTTRFA